MVAFIGMPCSRPLFIAMEMKEIKIVHSFNVVKTAEFCNLHFHERIYVGEKSYESF